MYAIPFGCRVCLSVNIVTLYIDPHSLKCSLRDSTVAEKETFLTKEITALNTKINTISLDRDAYYKENLKSNQLAGSRLEMIESLQETITQLQTKQKDLEVKHKEEIKALKVSFELEEIKSRPWWKLF
jgi:hypothetical protein